MSTDDSARWIFSSRSRLVGWLQGSKPEDVGRWKRQLLPASSRKSGMAVMQVSQQSNTSRTGREGGGVVRHRVLQRAPCHEVHARAVFGGLVLAGAGRQGLEAVRWREVPGAGSCSRRCNRKISPSAKPEADGDSGQRGFGRRPVDDGGGEAGGGRPGRAPIGASSVGRRRIVCGAARDNSVRRRCSSATDAALETVACQHGERSGQ
jgi:hypothetical protein